MRRPRLPAPPVPGGFGFPLGCLTATLLTLAAVAAGATTHPERALIALAAVTTTLASLTTLPAAVGTAAISWALHAGFVLGRHGDLALTPHTTRDGAILCAAAPVAFLIATASRTARTYPRQSGAATATVTPSTRQPLHAARPIH